MDLNELLKNKLYREIIKFFHENQASVDTPRGIAVWVKEERAVVKNALDELVKLGILVAHEVSSTTGYSYTQNKNIIQTIEKQLKNNR